LGSGWWPRHDPLLHLLADDVVAELDALVADEHGRARDQLAHLVLALAAEGAVQQLAFVVLSVFPLIGGEVWANETHGVVDRETRRHRPPGELM
jgi:hypothetical protein